MAGVALLAVVASGGVVGSTGAASANGVPSAGCILANAGAYDRSLAAGPKEFDGPSVAFASLVTGERLLFTLVLSAGDADTDLQLNDQTAIVPVFLQIFGAAPAGLSGVYGIPADGPRNIQYALLNLGDSVSAAGTVTVRCLDDSTPPDLLTITKEFTDDPAVPGGTATLEFTIQNTLQDTVTGIAFTDDLDAVLSGLAATDTPKAACGGTLNGTSTLSLAGATLSAGGSCTFSVTLDVPAGALGGDYPNTSSAIQGLYGAIQVFGSPASDTLSIDGPLPGPVTTEFIERFMWNRAGTLMGAGPAFQYFVDRFYGNAENGVNFAPLAYQAIPNGGGAAFDAMLAPDGARWALWAEGTFERYREGFPGTEVGGHVVMAQAGFDVLLGEGAILGLTVAGDAAEELSTDFGYSVDGVGWMAGPYMAIYIGDGVVLDGKFLWGTSTNNISPFLTYTDEFMTTRWLATARLAGEIDLGGGKFRPEVAFMYFRETQLEYVDTNGITIPEQAISRARLTFGPEIAIPVATQGGGTVEPSFSFEGVWDIVTADIYARLGGGLQITGAGGASLSLAGGYGGLFMPGFQTWNVSANLTVPLP